MLFEVMWNSRTFFFLHIILIFLPLIYPETQNQESEAAEELYKKLFKQQRVEQLNAIKSFEKTSNYEKQYAMITLMAEKIFDTIAESRVFVESSFVPGISEFPLDSERKAAISSILENTVLFSEIALRFPEISTSLLKRNKNWDLVLQWGIAFTYHMRHLLDDNTIQLLRLVSQELNHVERHPDYVNPYRKSPEVQKDIVQPKPKKKKKIIKKGPKLSSRFEL
ncbi:coiled-coil domain-containing protein 134-like [Diabrotica virgifera virgifera]|uniref:Coiled-coil domain-containing protein 134-like n=1 Tax=Diabrotica virgifera virgifera TaxID=50390 RepID=A0A6P7GSA7_DIAVI|nr:coiled-coil domain-containing protein 134-like [Diabrotica virgifera virgifera]